MSPFGSVTIGRKIYDEDIIIHADGSITKRKKKKSKHLKVTYGHTPLSELELEFLSEERPEVVYIGTGYQGALPITPEAMLTLKRYETVIGPTPEVVGKLAAEHKRFVALIHVTC